MTMKKQIKYEKNTWEQTLERIRLGDDEKNARLAAMSRAGLLKSYSDTVILIRTAETNLENRYAA